MSKLIDFFRQASQTGNQRMGFLSRKDAPPPKRLALLAVTETAAAFPRADAVVVRPDNGKLTAAAAKEAATAAGKVPWGLAGGASVPKGCDFIVLPLTGLTAAAPADKETGKLLELEASLDDGLLRAANDLPVDAVVLADALDEGGPLTWHRLMLLAHARHMVNKPMVVPVAADVSDADVKSLWDAGFDGIMVTAPAERIAGLADVIAALPPREEKKEKRSAVLPRSTGAAAAPVEVPEEPDEDDD
jgi:hypothetical protein